MSRSREIAILFLLFVAYVVMTLAFVGFPESSDLRAVWLAGHFFDPERPELIYKMSGGLFTMEPPDAWIALTLAEGRETSVFPFIYPPLWAWLSSLLQDVTDFPSVVRVASVLNFILIPLCLFLAWRIAGRPGRFALWAAIAFPILVLTGTFLIPIEENQPQILLSFLILLAIERQRSDDDVTAGAALALAAALKLYPVVFAILWMAAGERRAVAVFAVLGGALGLTSLAVAGWPMHAAMLGEFSAISKTAFLSLANFSVDSLWASLTLDVANLREVTTKATGGSDFWWVAPKSEAWVMTGRLLQLLVVLALILLARRTRMSAALLWPFAIIATSWVSPLAWTYHYIPAFAFAPVLVLRLGWLAGSAAIAIIFAAVFYPFAITGVFGLVGGRMVGVIGSLSLLLAAALFLYLARRDLAEAHAKPVEPATS